MDRTAQRLLHQIEAVDEHADVAEPAGLELRQMRDTQRDRLVGVERGEREAQHRCRRINAQHDRLAIEAANPDVLRDLPDHLDHRRLAAARAEKRKHVDRSVDGPFDVLVDQGFDLFKLAFVDRAMQCARKTPETVLCHDGVFPNWMCKTATVPQWTLWRDVIGDVRPGCCTYSLKPQIVQFGGNATVILHVGIAGVHGLPSRTMTRAMTP